MKTGKNTSIRTSNQGAIILVSYETPVAAWVGGDYFRTEEKYSYTTTKHINKWLDGSEAALKPQSFFDALLDT